MKLIAITTPKVTEDDVLIIGGLLRKGVDIIHLRKPDSGIDECRNLLTGLTDLQRSRIVVHDYPELYHEFSLMGIHVNKNVMVLPDGYYGLKTRSCHSFEEIIKYKDEYDYLFLSPIFDSISKVGYKSAFTEEDLFRASAEGIIDEKVVALGGVTFDRIPFLEELNFGGVAMIGGIYDKNSLMPSIAPEKTLPINAVLPKEK